MRVKYNRVSTILQTGSRFEQDLDNYDLTLLDKVSGSIPFFERPKGGVLKALIEEGKVKELIVEEFSRLGRNTGDVILVLDWLDDKSVNVIIRNLGIQSRPNGEKNPIWKMISSVLSSVYEMELANIRERTAAGRMIFLKKGGKLGRKVGTKENYSNFMRKEKSQKVLMYLKKGYTIREIAKIADASPATVVKVKKVFNALNSGKS